METSPLMQVLQVMDNPVVIVTLIMVMIGIRLLWLRSKKAHAAYPASSLTAGKAAIQGERPKDYGLETIDTILIALILVFGIVRPFLLQTFFIPSGSMEPTLLIHDKLIANKFVYRFQTPARGDVVVFEPPVEAILGNQIDITTSNQRLRVWLEENPQQAAEVNPAWAGKERTRLLMTLPYPPSRRDDFIKRVIGLPNDHIRIVEGEGVYVNGKLLPETYLPGHVSASAMSFPTAMPDPGPPPRRADFSQYLQDADGQFAQSFGNWLIVWYKYQHLYQDRIMANVRHGEFIVPRESVFVMGDNRSLTGSFDSRYWGVVPLKSVKARAVSTFWPLTRLKTL